MSEKNNLRKELLQNRKTMFEDDNGMSARKIAAKIIMLDELDEVKKVAGYFPINSEVDCLTIIKVLHAAFYPISLPAIIDDEKPLIFREWDLRSDLIVGPFNTKEPSTECAEVNPDIILVPLVGFDGNGYRLGYGGGYYDRTLAELRKGNPDLLAIGIAFERQKLDNLPKESHDQPLNMVVTEEKIYRFDN